MPIRLRDSCMSSVLATQLMLLSVPPATAQGADILKGIAAGRLVAISDGDFAASTYGDGVLAPREAGHRDVLTVLSIADGRVTTGSLRVSNSVTAAPEVLALTPDGVTAFVTERLGERPPEGNLVRDLPPGNRLFAVDLSRPDAPRLADTALIAEHPEGLSVSPDGRRVAVVSNTANASVVHIVTFADGRFGAVVRFDLVGLGITGTSAAPRRGVTASNVHWHPSGRLIAVNINTQNRVAFFAVDGGEHPELRSWGNVVEVGADPFVGRFTPDGRYYLTSNWGRNFAATDLAGRLPEAPSTISVIRLAELGAGQPRHERTQTVETGNSAEGIAVSRDGTLVATVNMRGTVFAPSSPRFQREASVSLLTFDAATGTLAKVGDHALDGVLPEGGAFDLTGEHFLATVFEGHRGAGVASGPGLEVFRVVKGARPSLARIGRVPLPHGVHHVDLAR